MSSSTLPDAAHPAASDPRAGLQQLFRTAEKFCFGWPVHTPPALDRAGSNQEN